MYSTEPPSSVVEIASHSLQLHGVDVGVATGVSVGEGVIGTSVSVGVGGKLHRSLVWKYAKYKESTFACVPKMSVFSAKKSCRLF